MSLGVGDNVKESEREITGAKFWFRFSIRDDSGDIPGFGQAERNSFAESQPVQRKTGHHKHPKPNAKKPSVRTGSYSEFASEHGNLGCSGKFDACDFPLSWRLRAEIYNKHAPVMIFHVCSKIYKK